VHTPILPVEGYVRELGWRDRVNLSFNTCKGPWPLRSVLGTPSLK